MNPRRRALAFVFVLICQVVLFAGAIAEEIRFVDGRVIDGRFISVSKDNVVIAIKGTSITIPRNQVMPPGDDLLTKARSCLEEQDYEMASSLCQQFLLWYPDDADAKALSISIKKVESSLAEAKEALRRNELEKASSLCREVLRLSPRSSEANELLRQISGKTQGEKALKELQELIAIRKGFLHQRRDSALVALFLDTEDPNDELPRGFALYQCYSIDSGGTSGSERVPLRVAWTRFEEFVGFTPQKRIEIDAGPPYEAFKQTVILKPGEVANLGHIVLRKVKAEGTAKITGVIKGDTGDVLQGATVTCNKGTATVGPDGRYTFEGFGLEIVNIKASKPGYFGRSATVSIRNMDQRVINQDLRLYLPRRVKFRYAISPEGANHVVGQDVETGTLKFVIDSEIFKLYDKHLPGEKFNEFAKQTRLHFSMWTGKLTLDNSIAPIFYNSALQGASFDSIKQIGPMDVNDQHCPQLYPGAIILINGGRISKHVVKILFEEIEIIKPKENR